MRIEALPWRYASDSTNARFGRCPVVAFGQVSVDTTIDLARALAIGDQTTGTYKQNLGGTAAIVAHNAAVLGGAVVFAGHVGQSIEDLWALDDLRAAGVEIGPTVATPIGLRVTCLVNPGGERTMVANGIAPDWAQVRIDFVPGQFVYFEGWHLFDETPAYADLIHRASDRGARVVVDVCSASRSGSATTHSERLRSLPISLLLANEVEASYFSLLSAPVAPLQVIHRGILPTLVVSEGRVEHHLPQERQAVDTTGAGDTFAAALITALSSGRDVAESVACAHRAAAEVVSVWGPLLIRSQRVLPDHVEPERDTEHVSV